MELDLLYLHEPLGEHNQVQIIFDMLAGLNGPKGRFFELMKSEKRFNLAMTELLAHPLQRGQGNHKWVV